MTNLKLNKIWGVYTPYCYIIIIRGIGYRAFNITNDFINQSIKNKNLFLNITENEFIYNNYLILRAGHTLDLYIGLANGIKCFITKKDRKLVLISNCKENINYLSIIIANYRRPSVYTGRGLRTKKGILIRKAGKKDKQKGKAF